MQVHEFNIKFGHVKPFDKPMASSRPRFKKGGGVYMKPAYIHHKEFLKRQIPNLLIDKEIKMYIKFYMPIAKSLSKVKKERLDGAGHVSKPDIDNLQKTLLDACNNRLYKDDSCISFIQAQKLYAIEPAIKVRVEVMEGE